MAVHMSAAIVECSRQVLAAISSCHPVSIKSRASEARQIEGRAPVVKCSGGVGMWSRLCLVHMSMPEVLLSIRQNKHAR